ncbi:MAG TPA: hypothetical protein DCL21_06450 [Alphaproteobacteria bacterium]|nr:hypothetical protein [Alphaproteobacteria bacterium]
MCQIRTASRNLVSIYVKHFDEPNLKINIIGQRVLFNGQPVMLLKHFEQILLELGYFHDVNENTVVTGIFKKHELGIFQAKESVIC